MPPAVGYAIAGIAAGLGQIGASHAQSKANTQAAQIESTANDKALAAAKEQQDYERTQQADQIARDAEQRQYQRNQVAQYTGTLQPFVDQGQRANQAASAYLGGSPYAARAAAGASSASSASATVMLKAPNGMTKAVPADQVEHYLARGAVRV